MSEYAGWWLNRQSGGWSKSVNTKVIGRRFPADLEAFEGWAPMESVAVGDEILSVGIDRPGAVIPIVRGESRVDSLCAVCTRNDLPAYVAMERDFLYTWGALPWTSGHVGGVAPAAEWSIARGRNQSLAAAPVTSHVLICDIDTRSTPEQIQAAVDHYNGSPFMIGGIEHRAGGSHWRYMMMPRALADSFLFDEEFSGIFCEDGEWISRMAIAGYVFDTVETGWRPPGHPRNRGIYMRHLDRNKKLICEKVMGRIEGLPCV